MSKPVILAAAAAAAVLLSSAASAGKKPVNPDKIVCRYEGDTTSRISRTRVCHTVAEWAAEDAQRRRDTELGLDTTGRKRELGNTFRNNVGELPTRRE